MGLRSGRSRWASLLLLAAISCVPAWAFAGPAQGSGRYLVVFHSESLPSNADSVVKASGGLLHRTIPEIGVAVVSGDAAFAAAIARHPSVKAVGAEHVNALPEIRAVAPAAEVATADGTPTAADNLYYYQWDMRRIGAPAVWSRLPLPTGGRVATVAVLDSGVMEDHPDLVGQVIAFRSTTYCNTPGGPSNRPSYPKYSSLIDFDAHPAWSPVDGCTPAATTYEAHGTHVSGTIAARFGGGRIVGVAPDARIAAYKVFDRYRYTDAAGVHDAIGAFDGPLFSAIVDAAVGGIPVVNMSLGSLVLRANKDDNASWLAWNRVAKLANRLGTLLVASSGNEEFNLDGPVAHVPSDIPTILSTSASGWSELVLQGGLYVPAAGSHDVLAFYSNHGSSVDLSAPGGDCGPVDPELACLAPYLILSSVITGTGVPAYAFYAGTSMAAPHVAAVAAMVRALHPDWTPGAVRSHLDATAQRLPNRQAFGHGVVDADAATR